MIKIWLVGEKRNVNLVPFCRRPELDEHAGRHGGQDRIGAAWNDLPELPSHGPWREQVQRQGQGRAVSCSAAGSPTAKARSRRCRSSRHHAASTRSAPISRLRSAFAEDHWGELISMKREKIEQYRQSTKRLEVEIRELQQMRADPGVDVNWRNFEPVGPDEGT